MKIKKEEVIKYKIDLGNVKKMTGAECDLYIFTIDQLNELLKEQIKKQTYTICMGCGTSTDSTYCPHCKELWAS